MTASIFANALPAGAYIPAGMTTAAPIPPPPPVVRPVTVSHSVGVCSGYGQYHTANRAAKCPKPYTTLSMANIVEMMRNPPSVDKAAAQWAIFTDYTGENARDAAHLRATDAKYYALWADIDEAAGVAAQEILSIASVAAGGAKTHVYTSRSATEQNQKARIVAPLAEPVDAVTFEIMQQVFNNRLEAAGLVPDRVTEVCNQLCYLPNRGAFYWSGEQGTQALNPKSMAKEVEAIRAAIIAEDEARAARMAANAARYAELIAKQGATPIQAAKEAYGDPRDLLIHYGGIVSGDRVISPNSSSGSAGVTFKDGKWFSSHGSDVAAGMGQQSNNGRSCWGDPFDLVCFFEYGNDRTAAVRAMAERFQPTENKQRQINHRREQDEAEALEAFSRAGFGVEPPVVAVDSDEPPVAMNSGAGVDVWSPPGIAGDICRLMTMRARRERPEIYPLAALQLLSLAANGRGSDYTNKLNLITLSIASTAAGKETPQDVVKTISNKLGLSRYIMGDMGSFKDMITNVITGQGTALYIMDEVHSMMDSMKSKNAASYETKIEAEILKLTTTALYTFRGADKRAWFEVYDKQIAAHEKKLAVVDKDTPEGANDFANLTNAINQCKKHRDYIENGWPDPYTGIMGHSVPERLDKFAGDPENIASGLLGRSLIARCTEGAERLKQPTTAAANILQADIVHRLERLVGSSQHIDIDDDASDYMAARSDYYEQETVRNDQHMGAIYRRSTEQLYKVATVLAIETSRITLEHAKYAAALVESSNSDIRYILTQAIAAREGAADSVVIGAARLRLLKAAKPLSGVTRGELKKTVTRSKDWGAMQDKDLTRDRFEDLLADLVGRGELVEVKTSRYRSLAVT